MQPPSPAESDSKQSLARVYRIDDLVVDTSRVAVVRAGVNRALPKLSCDLLVALIEAAPGVVSPDELMDRVWPGLVVSPETVSQRIRLLRDSLGDDSKSPRYVAGVRGRGYRLLPDVVRLGGPRAASEATVAVAVTAGKRRHFLLTVLTLGLVAAAGAWLLLDRGREAAPAGKAVSTAPLPVRSVTVLAFEERGGSEGTDILDGWLSLHLLRKEWRKAGEAAYAMIAEGSPHPWLESLIARAIRLHARTTGEYDRAIRTLEDWAAVSWDGDEPLLPGHLDQGIGVAGLVDLLMTTGQVVRARALAEALLADTEIQITRYGRGEIWLNDARAMAQSLLGRPDDAMATLQRQAGFGANLNKWQFLIDGEPAFEPLLKRADFRALLADVRANAARERERIDWMRGDGLVPDRS